MGFIWINENFPLGIQRPCRSALTRITYSIAMGASGLRWGSWHGITKRLPAQASVIFTGSNFGASMLLMAKATR